MKCKVCKAETATEKHGATFFVICKSPVCAERGVGRPLSDGKPTAAEAEANYAQALAEKGAPL